MVRFFRTSCLGLLAVLIFGIVAVLSVLAVMFQQSQAVNANGAATVQSRITPMHLPIPATLPLPTLSTGGDVTIQIMTNTPISVPDTVPLITVVPTDTLSGTLPSVSSAVPGQAATDVPRYSGTSSYPLTVTAEVMLGLTHVAGYQAGVAATRTAIAAESEGIFATLTAAAQLPTVSAP